MDWFKFYHNKWLSDPAIVTLAPADRLCYITILCLAAQDDERQGRVTRCNESDILAVTHIPAEVGKGVLSRLSERGLIEVDSNGDIFVPKFSQRQQVALTNAERQARYRGKKNSNGKITENNDTVTLEESRVEEIREDKSINTTTKKTKKVQKHKYGEYKNILLSDEEKQKLKEKFGVVKAKKMIENMSEAIEMKGYKYKSHYLALLKWERDDAGNKRFGANIPYVPNQVADELKVSRSRREAEAEEKEREQNVANNEKQKDLLAQARALTAGKKM